MNSDHEYFHKLIYIFQILGEPKYMNGAKEHNSHIWDMTDEQLEEQELFEMIDLLFYRLTRIEKRGSNPTHPIHK